MKKLLLLGAFASLGFAASAQTTGQFKIGANVGIPVGDASNVSSFTMGVDAAYQWRLAPNFDLGLATGYQHFLLNQTTKLWGIKVIFQLQLLLNIQLIHNFLLVQI